MHLFLADLNQLHENILSLEEKNAILVSENANAMHEVQEIKTDRGEKDFFLQQKDQEMELLKEKALEFEEKANIAAEKQIMSNCEVERLKEELQANCVKLEEKSGKKNLQDYCRSIFFTHSLIGESS